MADKRIKDLAVTASSPSGDDFFILDSVADDTRKIAADYFAETNDLPPPTPSFVSGGTYGTQMIVGDIPNEWQLNADITQLHLGNSVTIIGDQAFRNCTSLTGDLIIPDSVTSIGDTTFNNCAFDGVFTIGNSVTTIGSFAFYFVSPSLTGNLVLPDSITSIGTYAFASCAFSSVTIPSSVTSIGDYAFAYSYGPNLTTVNCYVTKTIIDAASNIFVSSASPLTINVRTSDETWTEGTGLSIGGNENVTVIKNL